MYRDAPPAGPTCARHPASPVVATCRRCGVELCEICTVYSAAQPSCFPCARRARRLRTALAGVMVLAVVAGVGAVVLSLPLLRPKVDHGIYAPLIRQLRADVARTPCDHPVVKQLAEELLKAGDARGSLEAIGAFQQRCGDWPRLRWIAYSAHEALGEHAEALAEATRLIEENPGDHDFWWWRGIVHERMGHDDEAIADYRKTLELLPSADAIPFNLAALLEKKGRPCDAREPIANFLTHNGPLLAEPVRRNVEARFDALDAKCRALGAHPTP